MTTLAEVRLPSRRVHAAAPSPEPGGRGPANVAMQGLRNVQQSPEFCVAESPVMHRDFGKQDGARYVAGRCWCGPKAPETSRGQGQSRTSGTHDMRRRTLADAGHQPDGVTHPGDRKKAAVERATAFVDASRSAALVETLRGELRRLRVLARCLAATEVALLARIAVSGFSVVAVTLVVALALLLLACVRLSLGLGAGAARIDASNHDTCDARVTHEVRRSVVSRRSVQGPGNGDLRRGSGR
jgi:hypothetical protein